MSKENNRVGCGLALLAALLIIPGAMLRGWVLKILWGWFVEPLGVPAISIVGAIGISALVAMLTYENVGTKNQKYDDDPKVNLMVATGLMFAGPLLTLGYAALVRWVAQ